MEVILRILLFIVVTFIYAYTFTWDIYRFLEILKQNNDKKTKRATIWLIFSVLIGLTLYVYVVRLFKADPSY